MTSNKTFICCQNHGILPGQALLKVFVPTDDDGWLLLTNDLCKQFSNYGIQWETIISLVSAIYKKSMYFYLLWFKSFFNESEICLFCNYMALINKTGRGKYYNQSQSPLALGQHQTAIKIKINFGNNATTNAFIVGHFLEHFLFHHLQLWWLRFHGRR